MTARNLAFLALALWLGTIAVAGWLFVVGRTVPASDGRSAILLTPAERDVVLGEMRAMLASVQGIASAIADGEGERAANAASAVGTGATHAVPATLMAKLPLEFKQLGLGVHSNFDTIAVAARQGEEADLLLSRLADQLSQCVACHALYRIDPEP